MEKRRMGAVHMCCRQRWVTFGVELEGGDPIGVSRGGWEHLGFSAFLFFLFTEISL
jgi:hypothetical protein